jgi:hypothetical protein
VHLLLKLLSSTTCNRSIKNMYWSRCGRSGRCRGWSGRCRGWSGRRGHITSHSNCARSVAHPRPPPCHYSGRPVPTFPPPHMCHLYGLIPCTAFALKRSKAEFTSPPCLCICVAPRVVHPTGAELAIVSRPLSPSAGCCEALLKCCATGPLLPPL